MLSAGGDQAAEESAGRPGSPMAGQRRIAAREADRIPMRCLVTPPACPSATV